MLSSPVGWNAWACVLRGAEASQSALTLTNNILLYPMATRYCIFPRETINTFRACRKHNYLRQFG